MEIRQTNRINVNTWARNSHQATVTDWWNPSGVYFILVGVTSNSLSIKWSQVFQVFLDCKSDFSLSVTAFQNANQFYRQYASGRHILFMEVCKGEWGWRISQLSLGKTRYTLNMSPLYHCIYRQTTWHLFMPAGEYSETSLPALDGRRRPRESHAGI